MEPWARGPGPSGERALRRASLQMGYLKKNGDGSLLYSVVNTAEPDADGGRLTRAPLTSVPFGDLASHGLPEMPLFPGHNAVVKCR